MLALVFALSFDRGIVAEALKTRLPQMMGVWSYAIYMGQTFWLQAIRIFEQRLYPPPDSHGAGNALFQPDLVAGADAAGAGLHCLGRGAGNFCRTSRRCGNQATC